MTLFGPDEGAEAADVGEQSPLAPPPSAPRSGPAGRELPAGVRIRMVVAYNGAGFRGFAAQRGVKTVAGSLAEALQSVIGHPIEITCAGRTDAGVHAGGQVVHFQLVPEQARDAFASFPLTAAAPPGRSGPGTEPDLVGIRRSCNRMLAPAIVVRHASLAPEGFDARRSALWRRYRYTVLNREDPDPFLAPTSWQVEVPLDLRSMQLSCDPIHGEHDFAAFCRQPPGAQREGRADGESHRGHGSTVRRVMRAEWTAGPVADTLRFEVVASAFCQQMVRSLVGTMVDVGRGRKTAGDMAWILRSGDRALAGSPAPPQGLCLEEVGYPEEMAFVYP